jgi:uncharacterized protein (TIGR02646 family)
MRKVNKDFSNPPGSLTLEITNRLREEIISKKKYPSREKKYEERYKKEDIKEALRGIYSDKCAYCEKSISDTYFHIDHYRPKSIYYWQVYSWDNLLLCCEKCNTIKRNKFEIEAGKRVEFEKKDLDHIHNLTVKYNEVEKPLMVNPELEDIGDLLVFEIETGSIKSGDYRCQYTIDACRLDRKEANNNRKKIWDDFYKKVIETFYVLSVYKKHFEENRIDVNNFESKHNKEINKLETLIEYFKEAASDSNREYLSFRRYIIKNHTLFAIFFKRQ